MHASALAGLVQRTEDELVTREIAWGNFSVLLEKAADGEWSPEAMRKVRAALAEWELRCSMYEYRLRDWEMAYMSGHAPLYQLGGTLGHGGGRWHLPQYPLLCNGNYLELLGF